MKEKARRVPIPTETRFQIKHEQGCNCLVCGNHKKESDLFIHHVVPVSHHRRGEERSANRRENLCALCGECHSWADHMALEKGVYLNEIIDMRPGVSYPLSRTGD